MSNTKPALTTDVSNYADTGYGDPSLTMKALTWQGKNQVKLGKYIIGQQNIYLEMNVCWQFGWAEVETARPTIVDDEDVILKVTGSTICGSDLHLLHCTWLATKSSGMLILPTAAIPEMHKGDILGHEFCGIVEKIGPKVKKRKIGERAVASFQIACGECYYCEKKLSSLCERTNGSASEKSLYGRRTAGMSPVWISKPWNHE